MIYLQPMMSTLNREQVEQEEGQKEDEQQLIEDEKKRLKEKIETDMKHDPRLVKSFLV